MEDQIQKIEKKLENNNLVWDQDFKNFKSSLSQILDNQKISKKKQDQILETAQRGFLTLALQNAKLLEANERLIQQLEIVVAELNQIKEEREEKATHKEAWNNRKRLPKRDPMTAEIYKELMRAAEGPIYTKLRTRIAMCLLAVTGIRVNELLPLKVSQLETLFQENWIAIDRSKRGPSSHKAFLTKEGKKIVQDRQKDFQLMFLMKEPNSYIFTSEADHSEHLKRVALTQDINKIMRQVSSQLPEQPNITSHSFRIGYITQLWKDSKDIEFVKQTIGHRKLDTTSKYVTKLSDQDRQRRMKEIDERES